MTKILPILLVIVLVSAIATCSARSHRNRKSYQPEEPDDDDGQMTVGQRRGRSINGIFRYFFGDNRRRARPSSDLSRSYKPESDDAKLRKKGKSKSKSKKHGKGHKGHHKSSKSKGKRRNKSKDTTSEICDPPNCIYVQNYANEAPQENAQFQQQLKQFSLIASYPNQLDLPQPPQQEPQQVTQEEQGSSQDEEQSQGQTGMSLNTMSLDKSEEKLVRSIIQNPIYELENKGTTFVTLGNPNSNNGATSSSSTEAKSVQNVNQRYVLQPNYAQTSSLAAQVQQAQAQYNQQAQLQAQAQQQMQAQQVQLAYSFSHLNNMPKLIISPPYYPTSAPFKQPTQTIIMNSTPRPTTPTTINFGQGNSVYSTPAPIQFPQGSLGLWPTISQSGVTVTPAPSVYESQSQSHVVTPAPPQFPQGSIGIWPQPRGQSQEIAVGPSTYHPQNQVHVVTPAPPQFPQGSVGLWPTATAQSGQLGQVSSVTLVTPAPHRPYSQLPQPQVTPSGWPQTHGFQGISSTTSLIPEQEQEVTQEVQSSNWSVSPSPGYTAEQFRATSPSSIEQGPSGNPVVSHGQGQLAPFYKYSVEQQGKESDEVEPQEEPPTLANSNADKKPFELENEDSEEGNSNLGAMTSETVVNFPGIQNVQLQEEGHGQGQHNSFVKWPTPEELVEVPEIDSNTIDDEVMDYEDRGQSQIVQSQTGGQLMESKLNNGQLLQQIQATGRPEVQASQERQPPQYSQESEPQGLTFSSLPGQTFSNSRGHLVNEQGQELRFTTDSRGTLTQVLSPQQQESPSAPVEGENPASQYFQNGQIMGQEIKSNSRGQLFNVGQPGQQIGSEQIQQFSSLPSRGQEITFSSLPTGQSQSPDNPRTQEMTHSLAPSQTQTFSSTRGQLPGQEITYSSSTKVIHHHHHHPVTFDSQGQVGGQVVQETQSHYSLLGGHPGQQQTLESPGGQPVPQPHSQQSELHSRQPPQYSQIRGQSLPPQYSPMASQHLTQSNPRGQIQLTQQNGRPIAPPGYELIALPQGEGITGQHFRQQLNSIVNMRGHQSVQGQRPIPSSSVEVISQDILNQLGPQIHTWGFKDKIDDREPEPETEITQSQLEQNFELNDDFSLTSKTVDYILKTAGNSNPNPELVKAPSTNYKSLANLNGNLVPSTNANGKLNYSPGGAGGRINQYQNQQNQAHLTKSNLNPANSNRINLASAADANINYLINSAIAINNSPQSATRPNYLINSYARAPAPAPPSGSRPPPNFKQLTYTPQYASTQLTSNRNYGLSNNPKHWGTYPSVNHQPAPVAAPSRPVKAQSSIIYAQSSGSLPNLASMGNNLQNYEIKRVFSYSSPSQPQSQSRPAPGQSQMQQLNYGLGVTQQRNSPLNFNQNSQQLNFNQNHLNSQQLNFNQNNLNSQLNLNNQRQQMQNNFYSNSIGQNLVGSSSNVINFYAAPNSKPNGNQNQKLAGAGAGQVGKNVGNNDKYTVHSFFSY